MFKFYIASVIINMITYFMANKNLWKIAEKTDNSYEPSQLKLFIMGIIPFINLIHTIGYLAISTLDEESLDVVAEIVKGQDEK